MEELFENLRENVSEVCFNDILGIVEEILEGWADTHNQQDLENIVNKAKESRKRKYKEAVASNAPEDEIETAKKRLHRANVLSHTSTLGNKKEKRSESLTNAYGKTPSVKSIQSTPQGEEPELASAYVREVKNLGKPEAQKENPSMFTSVKKSPKPPIRQSENTWEKIASSRHPWRR